MATPKRAKKFRQKHLPKKLENVKRARKLADKYGKKPARAGAPLAAPAKPTRDFDVKPQEPFDFGKNKQNAKGLGGAARAGAASGMNDGSDAESEDTAAPKALDAYLSDDEEEAAAEERAYLATQPTARDVQSFRKSLRRSSERLPEVLAAVSARSESTDVRLDAQLTELLLTDVPKALAAHFSPENAPPHALQQQLVAAVAPLLANADGSVLIQAAGASAAVLRVCSVERAQKQLAAALAAVVVRMSSPDAARLAAFDALRSCRAQPLAARQAYKALVRAAGRTNAHTMPTLNLAKNLFATLFEKESQGLYDVAFSEIRQLALHLKTALDRTKNAGYDVQVCYSWPYIHSLDFWSRALCASPSLRALVHPLCQVTLRTATLVPAQQYIPLRLHLVQSLVRLSRHTHTFIPVCPILLDMVMDTSCLSRPAKPSTLQRPDLAVLLHVPQMYVQTSVYQTAVVAAFGDAIVDALTLYATHIAFPELATPVLMRIKRFARRVQTPAVSRPLLELCQRIDAQVQFVFKARENVAFGPKDDAQIAKFLEDVDWRSTPLGKEAVAREKVREALRVQRENERDIKGPDDDNDADEHEDEDEDEIEEEVEEEEEAEEEEEEEEEED